MKDSWQESHVSCNNVSILVNKECYSIHWETVVYIAKKAVTMIHCHKLNSRFNSVPWDISVNAFGNAAC